MNLDLLREKLVKATLMLEHAQLIDMNGHISYRIEGTEQVLINSRGASRATLTTKDIVLIDLDGNLIEGDDEPPSEFHIHTSIYRARPDVHSVLHNHPHWQTVLAIAGIDSRPVFSIGSFVNKIPIYEKSSLVNIKEMGDEIAQKLGQNHTIHLRFHGSVIVDKDIESVFARSVFMEENFKKQYYAELLGSCGELQGDNLVRTRESNWSFKIVKKVWNYHEGRAKRDRIIN